MLQVYASGGDIADQASSLKFSKETTNTKIDKNQKTIMVDGIERPTQNSNGQPIYNTAEGIRNFWRWYDGVRSEGLGKKNEKGARPGGIYGADNGITGLDERGKPRVFYHGTSDSFDSFDLEHVNRKDAGWLGRGVYVTSTPLLAGAYANMKRGQAEPNTMPLYVALRNPFYASIELKKRLSKATQEQIDMVTSELQRDGFDGVVLQFMDGTVEAVAFNAEQVKSAIGNNGDFDPTKPSIKFSRDGLQSNHEVPNPSRQPRATPIDGPALAELRRAAAGIEATREIPSSPNCITKKFNQRQAAWVEPEHGSTPYHQHTPGHKGHDLVLGVRGLPLAALHPRLSPPSFPWHKPVLATYRQSFHPGRPSLLPPASHQG